MRALIIAAINPDNTPHGYNWTFAFPMLLFIVIALVLWALFGRPHHRVPARPLSPGLSSARPGQGSGGSHMTASAEPGPGSGQADSEPGGAQPPAGGAGAGE